MSKFYVTTAIPYVNAQPHIGHALDYLYADVLARYHRAQGEQVLFSAGTDEHGGKIAEKAAEAKITPQAYADQLSKTFEELLKDLNISNDRFIRTTNPAHVKTAQAIWKALAKYIYKSTYIGWYCTGHEEYFPEATVKANNGICPEHNRPYEQLQEENYFFKLSAFGPKIKAAIESDQLRVIPASRKNEIVSLITAGLEDISVSRPKDKISWGIAVPGDTAQVMYVWVEALMNYISVLGYPDHKDFKTFWPADMQVIGKDILRFHAAIWPAMLLGLELPLPKAIFAHGFIEVDGKKMSKTLGNVVAPKDVISQFGTDALRYYLLRHVSPYEDGNYTAELMQAAYNSELADQLGNAVGRVSAMINNYQQGIIGPVPEGQHDIAGYNQALADCRFDKALEDVWEQIKGVNQYVEETKPWEIAKENDADHLREVLARAVGSLLEIADLLAPFLPDTAAKVKAVFASGQIKPLAQPLFPKAEHHKES